MQNENRALRLKDGVTLAQYAEPEVVGLAANLNNNQLVVSSGSGVEGTVDNRVTWNYFDESGYIRRGGLKLGEDPYVRNRFNQEASDSIPSNRDVPDTRNLM